MFAIVGSRRCTRDGQRAAREIAAPSGPGGRDRRLRHGARRGYLRARGRAAAPQGRTIAVLGCGVDVIYPPENDRLAAQILDKRRRAGERISARNAAACRQLSRAQPHHQRHDSGHAAGGGREGLRRDDYRKRSRWIRTGTCSPCPGRIYSPLSAMPEPADRGRRKAR